MTAVAIERFGGLDQLKVLVLPKPRPGAGEVLIRVRAAGVGHWDVLQREGAFAPEKPQFPLIIGAECAGSIEQLGPDVTSLKAGDDVYTYFWGKQGAYAQYVAVKAESVAAKPAALSFEEASVAPVDGITAHQALVDDLKLASGEWLFVAGGSGGVGSLAVQIGIILGAKVIASARAANFGYLESLGVARENLIDYTEADVVTAVRDITGGKGVDAALDAAGGESSKQTLRAVRDGGRIAELTGQELPGERGIAVVHVDSRPSADRLTALAELFDAGQLKTRVAQVFELARAREAQVAVEQRHGPGGIALRVE